MFLQVLSFPQFLELETAEVQPAISKLCLVLDRATHRCREQAGYVQLRRAQVSQRDPKYLQFVCKQETAVLRT